MSIMETENPGSDSELATSSLLIAGKSWTLKDGGRKVPWGIFTSVFSLFFFFFLSTCRHPCTPENLDRDYISGLASLLTQAMSVK